MHMQQITLKTQTESQVYTARYLLKLKLDLCCEGCCGCVEGC